MNEYRRRFITASNSPEIIEEKANVLASVLFCIATVQTKDLIDLLNEKSQALRYEKVDPDKFFDTMIEHIFLYYHYVDRVAHIKLSSELRKLFSDKLYLSLIKQLIGKNSPQQRTSIAHKWNERQHEYAKYPPFPKKNEAANETIFYKFGYNVAKIFGLHLLEEEHSPDIPTWSDYNPLIQIVVSVYATTTITETFFSLELFDFLSDATDELAGPYPIH